MAQFVLQIAYFPPFSRVCKCYYFCLTLRACVLACCFACDPIYYLKFSYMYIFVNSSASPFQNIGHFNLFFFIKSQLYKLSATYHTWSRYFYSLHIHIYVYTVNITTIL